uniref:Transposase Tc1-like domain-containing protein n=1 Tax=Paramormyrops kingsleyae TaxID=1676925 RepID=A0A3B3REF2_9TELE
MSRKQRKPLGTVKQNPKTTVSDLTNSLPRAGVKVSQTTQEYNGHSTGCKPIVGSKNREARKYRDEPQQLWNKVLWTDETEINL